MSKNNSSKLLNKSETMMSQIYVFLFFGLTALICCLLIALSNQGLNTISRKRQAFYRMERVKNFRTTQVMEMHKIDSLYSKINKLNPGVHAQYEETEIRLLISDVKNIYEINSQDKRYEVFLHVSNMSEVWLMAKKELWGKTQNLEKFNKNLLDCEIGLERDYERIN